MLVKSVDAASKVTTVNEGDIIRAAQLIMESEALQTSVGNNEYYKMAETVLTGLSDEEIQALQVLLNKLRG